MILISVLVLTMAACGSNGNNTNDKTSSQGTEQAENGIISQKDDSETEDKTSVETLPEKSEDSAEKLSILSELAKLLKKSVTDDYKGMGFQQITQ